MSRQNRRGSAAAWIAAALALTIGLDAWAQPRNRNPNLPPPEATPRTEDGKVLLGAKTPDQKGVWTPLFGVTDPIAPANEVPFQPWARALYDSRQIHELEPHARCKASGTARQFLTPYGVEFVELPELERLYIFDVGGPHTFRTVHMDGRGHPRNISPSNYGHSIGWWEGDTLVIDSVGFNEDFWLDRRGLPHTEQMHTIERFTRINSAIIVYEITVDDPGAYTGPWTGTFNLQLEEGTELFEYICQQANYAHELMVGGDADSVDRSSPIVPGAQSRAAPGETSGAARCDLETGGRSQPPLGAQPAQHPNAIKPRHNRPHDRRVNDPGERFQGRDARHQQHVSIDLPVDDAVGITHVKLAQRGVGIDTERAQLRVAAGNVYPLHGLVRSARGQLLVAGTLAHADGAGAVVVNGELWFGSRHRAISHRTSEPQMMLNTPCSSCGIAARAPSPAQRPI
jgi:hypothetical protein